MLGVHISSIMGIGDGDNLANVEVTKLLFKNGASMASINGLYHWASVSNIR